MNPGKRHTPYLPVCLLAIFLGAGPSCAQAQTKMTTAGLGRHLNTLATDLKGGNGKWDFRYQGVPMIALADERFDRMRIISFIEEGAELDRQKLLFLLQANFDRTLDARYAVFRGFLVAAFIHPLSPLTPGEFESGLKQVANLVRSYGGTYSSGALQFRPRGQ